MKLLSALVLGYFVLLGELGAELQSEAAPKLETTLSDRARAFLDKVSGARLTPVPAPVPADHELDEPVRLVTRRGRVLNIPGGCRTVGEPYDLVIHFHGAPTAVEPAFERSGIDGAVFIVNLGTGSGRYEQAFETRGSFGRFVTGISDTVRQSCPGASPSVARVALSGWSAGYGAIWRILEREIDNGLIDGVLLADGLHAGFAQPNAARRTRRGRDVNPAQMAPFALFVDKAMSGEKLMVISHSAIGTPTYASTTETADFLLKNSGVARQKVRIDGPRPNMVMVSRADFGSLHVQGYAGGDKGAHADHLHAIGDTLFPLLRERWRN